MNSFRQTTLFVVGLFISFGFCFSQQSYRKLKTETAQKREFFSNIYSNPAVNNTSKEKVLEDSRLFLLENIESYFGAWNGTKWAFHGHTQTPRNGEIACGYFITTILRDMGFKIPRIKWAQLASENIVKKITTDIKRFRNKPMTEIVDYIKTKGEGLYIVGLDCHVGFIYHYKGKTSFVHSNYYKNGIGVMAEPLTGRNPLNDSKYRITGKILDDDMVRKWILNTTFPE